MQPKMWRFGSILLLIALILGPKPLLANPCVAGRVDGRNLIPEGDQSSIRIARETLELRLTTTKDSDGEDLVGVEKKQFTIDYLFVNKGKAKTVVMGFPIVFPGSTGVKNFAVRGRGVRGRVAPTVGTYQGWTKRSDLHWCEKITLKQLRQHLSRGRKKMFRVHPEGIEVTHHFPDMAPDEPREKTLMGWYFWKQHFGSGKNKLRVSYTMDAGGLCRTCYILRTSRYWGSGKIGTLKVKLRIDRPKFLKHFKLVLGKAAKKYIRVVSPQRIKAHKKNKARGVLQWRFKNFQANRDLFFESEPCGEG